MTHLRIGLAVTAIGLLGAGTAQVQTLTQAADRVNECRNGGFPPMAASYALARVRGNDGLIADDRFDRDKHWDPNTCPSDDAALCAVSPPVKAGTTVLVASHYRGYACVFVPGRDHAGWLRDSRLAIVPHPATVAWNGRWRDGDDGLAIATAPDGQLHVSGHAIWHGGNGNDHLGDIDFTARPVESRLTAPAGDTCRAELIKLGRYLIVRDNGNCGGVNVRFDGVYVRG